MFSFITISLVMIYPHSNRAVTKKADKQKLCKLAEKTDSGNSLFPTIIFTSYYIFEEKALFFGVVFLVCSLGSLCDRFNGSEVGFDIFICCYVSE